MTNFAGFMGRVALILVGACAIGTAHAQLDIDIVNGNASALPNPQTPARTSVNLPRNPAKFVIGPIRRI